MNSKKLHLLYIGILVFVINCNELESKTNYLAYDNLILIPITELSDSLSIRKMCFKVPPDSNKDRFVEGVKLSKDTLNRILIFYAFPDRLPNLNFTDLFERSPSKCKFLQTLLGNSFSTTEWKITHQDSLQITISYIISQQPERNTLPNLKKIIFYQEIDFKMKGDTLFTIVKHYTSQKHKLFLEKEVKIKL